MKKGTIVIFHVICCLKFAFAVYYDHTYTNVPVNVTKIHSGFGGKFKFLTFWDAIVQAVFFFLCILNDIFGTNALIPKKTPIVRKIKDYCHAAFSFPLAMFVGITFWSIWLVDRELILPKVLDQYFPWWLNHLMHTMIMVSIIIEIIISPRKYPKRRHGLGGLITFMLIYLIWMHVVYIKSGVWVYPVMDVLPWQLRILFFLVLLTFTVGLYFIGEFVDNLVWGNEQPKQRKSHSKSK